MGTQWAVTHASPDIILNKNRDVYLFRYHGIGLMTYTNQEMWLEIHSAHRNKTRQTVKSGDFAFQG